MNIPKPYVAGTKVFGAKASSQHPAAADVEDLAGDVVGGFGHKERA